MDKGSGKKTGESYSEKSGNWGSFGGNTPMHSWSGSGPQEPGQSSQAGRGGKREGTAKGGGDKAFVSSGVHNTDFAGTKEAGCSGPSKTGGNEKFASGGKTHMWGNRGSKPAVAGQSGPNG